MGCFTMPLVNIYSVVQTSGHSSLSFIMRMYTALTFVMLIFVVLFHQGNGNGCLLGQYQILVNNTNPMYDCLEFGPRVESRLECGLHCTSAFLPHAPHGFTYVSSEQLCACYPFSHEKLASQPPPARVSLETDVPGRQTMLCKTDMYD